MLSMRKGRFALVMLILVAVAPLPAEPPAPSDKVTVSVVAILGHKRDDKIDPRLKCIAEEVQKMVPKLTGFKTGKMTCKPVAVGGRETFELVDNEVAVVSVVQVGDKENLTQIRLTAPRMSEVMYETSCGRFLPIITKYRTKNGDLLIVAVRVQPCPK